MEDTILYSSCWDANGGLFETILGAEDAVISDELNHASIIDGIRLCKARRLRYKNNDMADLEARLVEAKDARFRLIATDGVFSMDGTIANLKTICDLADKYGALVMVDDSHAVGFMGKNWPGNARILRRDGQGRHHHGHFGQGARRSQRRVHERAGRNRHNAAPAIEALPFLEFRCAADPGRVAQGDRDLHTLDRAARPARGQHQVLPRAMSERKFNIVPGEHPITPIMIGDAALAGKMAERLLVNGVYAIGFSYPVVPQSKARVRVQVSAAHSRADLDFAIDAFTKVRDELGL